MPSADQSSGMTVGAPLLRTGTTWSGGEVRALALTATPPRKQIQNAELHEQLASDPSLRILHPSAAVMPIQPP